MVNNDNAANAPLIQEDASDGGSQYEDDSIKLHESEVISPSLFIWALTFTAGISGILFGYDTGVISSTLVSIGSDLSHRPLSTLDKSLVTSCTSFFALVASPIAGLLADKLGRKKVILVADILFIVGALWQAWSGSVWSMIAGRSIVGLAVGGASLVVPLYISELSPSAFRGRLVTLSVLFVTGGQVVAYVIGWLLSMQEDGWRWMVGLGATPAILQFGLLILLPETPRWLVKVGKTETARKVLEKVYGAGSDFIVQEVLRGISKEVQEEEVIGYHNQSSDSRKGAVVWLARLQDGWTELFSTGATRRALTIACMLQALQQLCGFNSLMYFSATIFSLVGFESPTLASLSIALTNFAFTLVALILIDRVGRRRMLLLSMPVMIGGLVLCSVAFNFLNVPIKQHEAFRRASGTMPSLWALIILAAMVVYVCGYALGLGNIPWQQSELFPLSVRSLGSGLATATNWGSNFIVGLTFLPMMGYITPMWTFAVYALICVAGWGCAWRIYPETKGLGLEEVGGLLKDGWGVKESLRKIRTGH